MHWYNVPKNTSRRKVFADALILFISITNKCLCNNAKEYCNFIKCYYNYNIKQKKTKTKNKKRITITIKNITNLWDQENCCLYVHFKRILPGLFANYLLIKLSMISRWWDHQPLLVKSRSHQCLWVHLITTNVLAICLAIWHGHLFKKNTWLCDGKPSKSTDFNQTSP